MGEGGGPYKTQTTSRYQRDAHCDQNQWLFLYTEPRPKFIFDILESSKMSLHKKCAELTVKPDQCV